MTATATLTYLTGDATAPVGTAPAIIAHVCNDAGGWGRGFVLAVSQRWPEPEAAYRRLASRWRADRLTIPLNTVQLIAVELLPRRIWVANIVAQVAPGSEPRPIRYAALRAGLGKVARAAIIHQADVHMPRLGAGLAGGDWAVIEPIIVSTLVEAGINAYVYTLPAG